MGERGCKAAEANPQTVMFAPLRGFGGVERFVVRILNHNQAIYKFL